MTTMTSSDKILGYTALALIGVVGWLADQVGPARPTRVPRDGRDPRSGAASGVAREAVTAAAASGVVAEVIYCGAGSSASRTHVRPSRTVRVGRSRPVTSGSRARVARSSPDGPRRAASSAASAEPLDRSRRRSA